MYNCLFGFQKQGQINYGCRGECKKNPVVPHTEKESENNKQKVQTDINKYVCSGMNNDPNNVIFVNSSLGEITLPANTERGTTYNIASVNIAAISYKNSYTELNFSCNIITTKSSMQLRFQIFKKGLYQSISVPVSTGMVFFRAKESSEANTFSIIACDYDSVVNENYNYSVYVEVMGSAVVGNVSIVNPILIALIVENI